MQINTQENMKHKNKHRQLYFGLLEQYKRRCPFRQTIPEH